MKKQYVKPEAVEVSFALAECIADITSPDVDYETSVFNRLPVEDTSVFG